MKAHRRTLIGSIAAGIPFLALFCAVILLILSKYVVSYQPFLLRGIEAKVTCVGEPVVVTIDRKFIGGVDTLELTESWVTVDVPRLKNGIVVKSNSGSIPEDRLTSPENEGFVSVESPLLQEAPPLPGVYKIKIDAQAFGTRWGIFPTDYERTFYSDPIKVKECNGKGQGT